MPDTKSPAELESQARQPLPITTEPACGPAAIEDEMRRTPSAPDPSGLLGSTFGAPLASAPTPPHGDDSGTFETAPEPQSSTGLDAEPHDLPTSERPSRLGSGLATSPEPTTSLLEADPDRAGADDAAPFAQHPATSPSTLEPQAPAPSSAHSEHSGPDLADTAEPTSQQLHGDIDSGRTGDKAPGFDPAAAPMNTDAEAGGAPPTGAEVAQARQAEQQPAPKRPNAVAPELTPDGMPGRRHLWLGVLAGAALAAIVGWILNVLV